MIAIQIQDLEQGVVDGIEVQTQSSIPCYKEDYFEWAASSLVSKFRSNEISCGFLKTWHHVPEFNEIETHVDTEVFCFISGVALMIFIDINEGKPDMKTAQIVRIKPGTQFAISAGKGHFVAVAEGSDPVHAVVVSPKMEAPRMTLKEPIIGI